MILVYPGPPDKLAAKATEFTTGKMLPDNFDLLSIPATNSQISMACVGTHPTRRRTPRHS